MVHSSFCSNVVFGGVLEGEEVDSADSLALSAVLGDMLSGVASGMTSISYRTENIRLAVD